MASDSISLLLLHWSMGNPLKRKGGRGTLQVRVCRKKKVFARGRGSRGRPAVNVPATTSPPRGED